MSTTSTSSPNSSDKPRGQLETAEAGAQDDDPHQRWFSASSEEGSPAMRVCHIRRGCVMSNGSRDA